jgi:hypothetical protein
MENVEDRPHLRKKLGGAAGMTNSQGILFLSSMYDQVSSIARFLKVFIKPMLEDDEIP